MHIMWHCRIGSVDSKWSLLLLNTLNFEWLFTWSTLLFVGWMAPAKISKLASLLTPNSNISRGDNLAKGVHVCQCQQNFYTLTSGKVICLYIYLSIYIYIYISIHWWRLPTTRRKIGSILSVAWVKTTCVGMTFSSHILETVKAEWYSKFDLHAKLVYHLLNYLSYSVTW